MAQLRQDYDQFERRGAEVVIIGPDGPDAFRRFWQEQDMPMVGLPDPDHEVADLYGQNVNFLKLGRLPSLILVDREGVVRYVHHGSSMSDIPPTNGILALLDSIN